MTTAKRAEIIAQSAIIAATKYLYAKQGNEQGCYNQDYCEGFKAGAQYLIDEVNKCIKEHYLDDGEVLDVTNYDTGENYLITAFRFPSDYILSPEQDRESLLPSHWMCIPERPM